MDHVFATTTAQVVMPGGNPIHIQAGRHWRADDPVVVAHPGLFSRDPRYGMCYSSPELQAASEAPDPVASEPLLEQATAAPGERRAVRRPT